MSIKFLTPYGPYPANSIVTLDSATEAALVADKVATTTLTGGVTYTPPTNGASSPSKQAYADASLVSGAGNAGIIVPTSSASVRAMRKALDQVRNGVAVAPWLVLSDSTGRGPNNTHAQAWPTYLVAALNAAGIPASIDSVYGTSNIANTASFTTADPRVVAGAGWTINSGVRTAGGGCFEFQANTTPTALAFTPSSGNAWDTVDIYFYQNSGAALGTFTVDRGGVAPTAGSPVNTNTAPQLINKVTLSWGSAAAGTLNIQVPNSTSPKIRILGFAVRNSAVPKLEFINASWAGSASGDWINGPTMQTGPWGALAAITQMAPGAILFGHKVNNFNPGTSGGGTVNPVGGSLATSVAAYASDRNTYAALAAAFAVTRQAQSDPAAFASISDQEAYFADDVAAATANGWPVVDFQAVCGGYTQATADGLSLDQRHWNSLGTQRAARQFARMLAQL